MEIIAQTSFMLKKQWPAQRTAREQLKELPELLGRGSRETTAPLDEDNQDSTPSWHFKSRLKLTFSQQLKTGSGIVLGTDPNSCDIVVPALRCISRRHCYLTFNDQRRLVVRDCSTYGTIVTYDGEGGETRRHFTWIIGGHEVPKKTIVIQLDENLKFQIVVSKPTFLDVYHNNVDQFLKEAASNAELPFGALGIQSTTSTAATSGTHTPKHDPILLQEGILGKGAFSVVNRVWDISTGLEYASKKFHNLKTSDWKKEADLMRQTSHEHIVRLEFEMEVPSPQLVLEYLPLGNLEDQDNQECISIDEVLALIHQSLSALTYLHGQRPSIAHRDIKPQNILVQRRKPFHIKLADFGLSKASDYLETLCGTLLYAAPEILQQYGSTSRKAVKYTNAVDIWSLGVVIFEYGYGLPHRGNSFGIPWCRNIIKKLKDEGSDGLIDLLSTMLVIDPKLRDSAEMCLRKSLMLPIPRRSPTLTAESTQYGFVDNPTIRVPANDFPGSQRTNSLDLIRDSEIQHYIRSEVPAALTITEKRKKRSAASSNSSGRRGKRSNAPNLPCSRRYEGSVSEERSPSDQNYDSSLTEASGPSGDSNSLIKSEGAFEQSTIILQNQRDYQQMMKLTWTESYRAGGLLDELRNPHIQSVVEDMVPPICDAQLGLAEDILPPISESSFAHNILASSMITTQDQVKSIQFDFPVPEFNVVRGLVQIKVPLNGTIETFYFRPEDSSVNMTQVLKATGLDSAQIRKVFRTRKVKISVQKKGPKEGRGRWVKWESAFEWLQEVLPELIAPLEIARYHFKPRSNAVEDHKPGLDINVQSNQAADELHEDDNSSQGEDSTSQAEDCLGNWSGCQDTPGEGFVTFRKIDSSVSDDVLLDRT